MTKRNNINFKNSGFTIVELLVVIVVIGILAFITAVSYSGVSNNAINASLQTDLSNDSKLLKMYNVEYGSYPSNIDNATYCPTAPKVDNKYCLKASPDTALDYSSNGQTFTLKATKNTIAYQVTESTSPALYQGLTGPDWIKIGTQTWATANSNVGQMVPGTLGGNNTTSQTNNSILEKYCYQNNPANCATYGGLYQWDEAMQYVNTGGAQGICPAGSHIPTDAEWKTLEMSLSGMSQATADSVGFRGTNEGTKLKSGGSSGLNLLIAGFRDTSGNFNDLSTSYGYAWSSTESSTSAWMRGLSTSSTAISRNAYTKADSFSVRCLGN